MIENIRQECLNLCPEMDISDESIQHIIDISKEDLIENFGSYDDDLLYRLSVSNVKRTWCRSIKQYSNNPLNELIDVDSIIREETIKIENIFSEKTL